MKNAARRKAKGQKAVFRSNLTKAVMVIGAFVFAAGACVGIKKNSDWYSARKDVIPTSVHVTNYEESLDPVEDSGYGATVLMQSYHLVGTYENKSGNKSVVVLDEAYSNKSFADEQIGSDRQIYLDASTYGAAGIKEVSVPDFDKSFVPCLFTGAAVSLIGAGLFIYTKNMSKKLAN